MPWHLSCSWLQEDTWIWWWGGEGGGGKALKDTLWVLRRDEPLVHVSVNILLISKHILDHVISLES